MEESLQYYRAFYPDELVPQDLHSELLEEALHVEVAASKASLLGNRLASTWLGNELLVCSPCGKIGETLKLSVVSDSNEDKNQVRDQLTTGSKTPRPYYVKLHPYGIRHGHIICAGYGCSVGTSPTQHARACPFGRLHSIGPLQRTVMP